MTVTIQQIASDVGNALARITQLENTWVSNPPFAWTYYDFFSQLHTAAEQDRFLDLEDALAAATLAGTLDEPANAGVKAFRRFRALANTAPVIRLDNASTVAGIGLLKALGVYGADPAATDRVAQVLAGTAPA